MQTVRLFSLFNRMLRHLCSMAADTDEHQAFNTTKPIQSSRLALSAVGGYSKTPQGLGLLQA